MAKDQYINEKDQMHIGMVACWLRVAWASARRVTRRSLRSPKVWTAGLAMVILVVGAVGYECYSASSNRSPEMYPLLALDEHRSLLVLAPHCDDEVLGAGGLIQAALRQELNVHVVIATAGDGYRLATMTECRRALLKPEDFIAMGERRQQESLDALTRLGLDADRVTFLGYPERGLTALWWDHWQSDKPYRSPYSKRDHNQYPRAFHPDAPHSGEALLGDLRAILTQQRPDLIVMPHPNDEHIDHRILSAFTTLAVEMEQAEDPTFQPRLLGYLVHYGLYPQPFGLKPEMSLSPPRQLELVGEWLQWRLSAEELAAKREAVELYRSQQKALGYFLNSFMRQNELFVEVDGVTALGFVEGEAFPDADSGPAVPDDVTLPGRDDPVKDSVVRRVRSEADITGLHVLRLGDSLWVALGMRGRVSRAYRYTLYVRAITPDDTTTWSGHYGQTSTDGVLAYGHLVWYHLHLDTLGQPDWLALAAEVRQGLVLDRTAWYLIRLEDDSLDALANHPFWSIISPDTETRDAYD